MELINDKAVLTTDVIGLAKFTDYEFKVLAFTSVGDGPNSTVESETTKEDGKKLILIISKFNLLVLLVWNNVCKIVKHDRSILHTQMDICSYSVHCISSVYPATL